MANLQLARSSIRDVKSDILYKITSVKCWLNYIILKTLFNTLVWSHNQLCNQVSMFDSGSIHSPVLPPTTRSVHSPIFLSKLPLFTAFSLLFPTPIPPCFHSWCIFNPCVIASARGAPNCKRGEARVTPPPWQHCFGSTLARFAHIDALINLSRLRQLAPWRLIPKKCTCAVTSLRLEPDGLQEKDS